MPKILLVIPPCFTNRELDFEIGFPVNIALLGDVARSEGWDVEYLDMTLEEKDGYDSFSKLDRLLAADEIKLVGISNHTVRTSVTTSKIAERVKSLRPELQIVVGGVNATFMTREILESCSAIDHIIRGYAQPGLRALVRSLKTEALTPVPGIATITDGVISEEPMIRITVDDFATPSLLGLDISRYLEWTRTYPLLTHTGCSFSCNFCTSVMPGPYQSKELYRPIEDVIKEMAAALDLGFDRFFISDNIFTSDRDYCVSLCTAMREGGVADRCTWVCMTRVELVDAELLSVLRDAGCINIAFGVETAGVDQWRSLRKGKFSHEVIQRAFGLARDASIGTTAYLMLGSPTQTKEDVEATIDLIRQIDPDFRVVSFFQPFPGTPYWEYPAKFGLSEIAPFEDWNFHEGPICRTKHLDKRALEDAAVRIMLENNSTTHLNPETDRLCWNGPQPTFPELPDPALEFFSSVGTQQTVRSMFDRVTTRHGTRGRLIGLYWLAAASRDRALEFVQPANQNSANCFIQPRP